MRAVLLILILAIVAILIAIGTGFLDIKQVSGVRTPEVSATSNGVTARGGQAPAFEVQTGSLKVGSQETTVKVPTVVVQKPGGNEAAAATNNAM